jgi:hypothetical protein
VEPRAISDESGTETLASVGGAETTPEECEPCTLSRPFSCLSAVWSPPQLTRAQSADHPAWGCRDDGEPIPSPTLTSSTVSGLALSRCGLDRTALYAPFLPSAATSTGMMSLRLHARADSRLESRVTMRIASSSPITYSDEKVANRDTKVSHGATVNGP